LDVLVLLLNSGLKISFLVRFLNLRRYSNAAADDVLKLLALIVVELSNLILGVAGVLAFQDLLHFRINFIFRKEILVVYELWLFLFYTSIDHNAPIFSGTLASADDPCRSIKADQPLLGPLLVQRRAAIRNANNPGLFLESGALNAAFDLNPS